MKVFAYGSNLSSARLLARAPSACFVGRARLAGHSLRFHKRGRDGSAKADAFRSGRPEDCVWGAVFRCSPGDKAALDRIEGVGRGYDDSAVRVEMDDGRTEIVRAYVARREAIDATLLPFTWYHAWVLTGAREHGLPSVYVEALGRHPAVPDPDPGREARNTPASA